MDRRETREGGDDLRTVRTHEFTTESSANLLSTWLEREQFKDTIVIYDLKPVTYSHPSGPTYTVFWVEDDIRLESHVHTPW